MLVQAAEADTPVPKLSAAFADGMATGDAELVRAANPGALDNR